MARSSTRTTPTTSELLLLDVLSRERVSPHVVRVALGGDDADRLPPAGLDQWFRLFIPVEGSGSAGEAALHRMPDRLTTATYLRYLASSRTNRPLLRAYTVRGRRPGEVDVDVVVHGDTAADGAGPGSLWAQRSGTGDPVALIDEGVIADRAALCGDAPVLLVADESAMPAAAGILASLPRTARGTAVVEVPDDDDRQPLDAPPGVEVRWAARSSWRAAGPGGGAVPGRLALEELGSLPVPEGAACWVAGEQSLVRDARRHWVAAGVPKDRISFTGYWRHGRSS